MRSNFRTVCPINRHDPDAVAPIASLRGKAVLIAELDDILPPIQIFQRSAAVIRKQLPMLLFPGRIAHRNDSAIQKRRSIQHFPCLLPPGAIGLHLINPVLRTRCAVEIARICKKHYKGVSFYPVRHAAQRVNRQFPVHFLRLHNIFQNQFCSIPAADGCFENGRPLKSDYKRFAIKEVAGQDDFASMAEVLRRRFLRWKAGDPAFSRLPDLILLDGGKGQVSAVRKVMEELGIDLPLFGMVKDHRHRTRAIVNEEGEIALSAVKAAFTFVTAIQDEVHRFAIAYQRTLHKKAAYDSELKKIPGIGDVRAKPAPRSPAARQRSRRRGGR